MKFYPGWPNENDPEDEKGDPTLPYIDGVPVESPQTDDDDWTIDAPLDPETDKDIDDEEELNFGE